LLIKPTTITGHVDAAESHVNFSFQSESNFATIGDNIKSNGAFGNATLWIRIAI